MKFNQLVFNRLELIFQKYNLHVTEQFKNYVKLESDAIVITISHNDRENSNALYLGRKEKNLYPIDEFILQSTFNSNLKINQVTQEMFVNNLAIFFEGERKSLISGNIYALKAVEKYVFKESKKYTKELVDKQNINAANKAWEEGNYEDFIKYLDKTDRQKLPSSYDLKYKIAIQKLR